MTRRHKLLTGLSTLTIAGALALSGCGEGEGEGEGAEGEGDATAVSEGEGAEGEGEGEGSEGEGGESEGAEGEGGESEGGASSSDLASDDVEYLRRLGLVRGHLVVFVELYRAGDFDRALMHAKHPESELYGDLEPAFVARGVPGFAEPLAAVADAASARGDVETAYAALVSEIQNNAPETDVATNLMAISRIVSTAADEFALGVDEDGATSNIHEYQDAYGFLTAAKEILATAAPTNAAETEAVGIAEEQLDKALSSFSGLTAAQTTGKASTIYGAAARIEIAALGLD